MKNTILFAFLSIISIHFITAQEVKNETIPDAEKTVKIKFQADAITFDSSISITALKQQTTARISLNNDTAGVARAGYSVLSYTFILVSSRDGKEEAAHKVVSSTNSLEVIRGVLAKARPGDFIMFADIKLQQPLTNKQNTAVRYIENYSGTLVE